MSLTAIFSAMLTYQQRQELERAAPDRLEVPSGSRIRIDYRPGETPVLAVRLQEMFGLQRDPGHLPRQGQAAAAPALPGRAAHPGHR